MPVNRKTNNSLVEKFGDYAHLYLYLNEVEVTDDEGSHTEYEGPLTVMETTLDVVALEDYLEALIVFAPAKSTKEAALAYLEDRLYGHQMANQNEYRAVWRVCPQKSRA